MRVHQTRVTHRNCCARVMMTSIVRLKKEKTTQSSIAGLSYCISVIPCSSRTVRIVSWLTPNSAASSRNVRLAGFARMVAFWLVVSLLRRGA